MSVRAYVSNLTLRIPLTPVTAIQTKGRLLSVQAPKPKGRGDGSYKLCTVDGVPVRRAYVNPLTDEIVADDDLRHYIQGSRADKNNPEPEVKQILSPEEYAEVIEARKSPLPKDIVELTVHPPEAADQMWPTSERNSYVFEPDETDSRGLDAANVIRALLAAGYVLVSVANIRNSEGFYRLTNWKGHIVLESMVHTSALNPHEYVDIDVDDDLLGLAKDLGAKFAKPFDGDAYRDERLARIRAVEAAAKGEAVADRIEAKRDEGEVQDLRELLSSILDSVA